MKKGDILENTRCFKSFFVGDSNEKIIGELLKSKIDSEIVKEFFDNHSSAYTVFGVYLQKKIHIDNDLLICLSALDTIACGHSKTNSSFIKVGNIF